MTRRRDHAGAFADYLHKRGEDVEREHAQDCSQPGFRYGLTRRDGRVVMFCKNGRCPGMKVV